VLTESADVGQQRSRESLINLSSGLESVGLMVACGAIILGSCVENDGYNPPSFSLKNRVHYLAWYSVMNTLWAGGFSVPFSVWSTWEN